MARNNIAGVLLPTTQNIEKLPVPPIKLMREHNMIVALGSDFCPNAHCYNMAIVAHLACVNYRLTPKEALAAATINSAYALGVSDRVGSIEAGKKGDILLLDAPEWVCLMYMFGDTPIEAVIKEGVILAHK
jgi:imidazolonepropionase